MESESFSIFKEKVSLKGRLIIEYNTGKDRTPNGTTRCTTYVYTGEVHTKEKNTCKERLSTCLKVMFHGCKCERITVGVPLEKLLRIPTEHC